MKIEKIKISNYRTLDNIDIDINTFYTAVCGKNNAGKSNLVQAVRSILGFDLNPFQDEADFEVNHKNDYTIWKADKSEPISFAIQVRLFSSTDSGLIKFIEAFAKSEGSETIPKQDSYSLSISTQFHRDRIIPEIEVVFEKNKLEEFPAREVLSKIRNSKTLIFHNSTETARDFSRFHGYFDDFTQGERTSIKTKREVLQKEFKKISERHKKDLSDLLGRLNEKYDITLTVPGFNFDRVPYEISLGEKDFGRWSNLR